MGKSTLQDFLTRLVICCMFPLLLLAGYLAVDYINKIQAQYDSIGHRLAKNIAEAVDNEIETKIAVLRMLAGSPSIDDPDLWPHLYKSALSFHEQFGGHVILADLSMQMLFNTRMPFGSKLPKLPVPKGHAAAPAAIKTGKPSVGDSFLGPLARQQLIAVAVPVIRTENVRYLLLGTIDTHLIRKRIDKVALPEGWKVSVIDGAGIPLAQRDSGKNAEKPDQAPEDKLFSAKLENAHWTIELRVPQNIYNSPILKAGSVLGLSILVAVALGIWAGRLIGRRLTEAVERVTDTTSNPEQIEEIESVRTALHRVLAAKEDSEEALKVSEYLNRALVKFLPVRVFAKSLTSIYLFCNEAYARDLGLQVEDVVGKTDYELHPGEKAEMYLLSDREVMGEGRIVEFEERRSILGTERWVHLIKSPIRMDDGEIIGVVGIVEDITERKNIELSTIRSENVLQLFIKYAPASIAMFDREMRYISVSQRFLQDYGIPRQQVIGRSHYEIFPELPEKWKRIHQRCLSGHTEKSAADSFSREDGSVDWVRWEIRPWHEAEGKVGGIVLFSEVITEEIENRQKIKESEEKFRDIFLEHSAVKLILDPDSGAIIDANKAAEKFYGWTIDQLLQMNIRQINTLPSERLEEEISKAKNQQKNYFEVRHCLADGSIRDVAMYTSKVMIQGKSLLHSIIHDISERKRVEAEQRKLHDQLLQSQKMELIGQLAGGVAHDFNNMLSVIIGYSEMAMTTVEPDSTLYKDLHEILNAANRSASITRQLLAFARKQAVDPQLLNLNETIKGMLKMLQRLIGEDIYLVWSPGSGLWNIKMDAAQIDQILANLCINARHAIAGVGKIVIETQNVTFNEEDCNSHYGFLPGDYVMLAVSDDGSGMDKETQEHIFEPFFTTKIPGQGTGLGLSTIYGIIKQNQGLVNVYSEPGEGATFRIYLPRYAGAGYEAEKIEPLDIPTGNGEVVLLVEDEESIRKMCRTMLKALNYQVFVASSPAAALRLIEEQEVSVDLLLTDVVMPEMNGRELSERIAGLFPDIRTLFISGYTSDIIIHRGVLAEGVDLLQKPFSRRELALRVHDALARHYKMPRSWENNRSLETWGRQVQGTP